MCSGTHAPAPARRFIRHSIALATILNDLGDRLEALLSPAARVALETVGPGETAVGWLEHMRQLIRVKARNHRSSRNYIGRSQEVRMT